MNRKTREIVEAEKAAYLGVQVIELSTEAIEMYNMPQGAFIVEAVRDGAAEAAGLKKGDIIVKMDGQRVSGGNDLLEQLQYYEAGEVVTLSWGINTNLFTPDTQLCISLSDNFGQTFDYLLAEHVSALQGSCSITLPRISFDCINHTFGEAERSVRPGILRIDIEGSIAYTLTCLHPEAEGAAGGFTMSGESPSSIVPLTTHSAATTYRLNGTPVSPTLPQASFPTGCYIRQGKKVWIRAK
jgi:hypothetical protein